MPKKLKRFNQEEKSFKEFAESINNNATKQSYTYSLNELLRYKKYNSYDKLASLDGKQIQDLLKNWVISLKGRGLKYKTIATKLDAVDLFFDMNEKIWNKKIVRIKLPKNDNIPGGDVPFTTEELWEMKKAAKHPRDKALLDFIASTGIRPGGLSDPILRIKHVVEMPHNCKAVKIYDESKEGYWSFLTPEASKSLKNYLGWRKFNHEKLDDDSILFKTFETKKTKKEHLTNFNIRRVLEKLMRWAGTKREKKDNRYDKAVVYAFRKRFNGILKMNNDVNSNIAEKLMAHKKGLDGAYLQPTKEQCFKEFRKAIAELTIDPTERQKAIIEQQDMRIDELNTVRGDSDAIKDLKDKQKKLEDRLSYFEKEYEYEEENEKHGQLEKSLEEGKREDPELFKLLDEMKSDYRKKIDDMFHKRRLKDGWTEEDIKEFEEEKQRIIKNAKK